MSEKGYVTEVAEYEHSDLEIFQIPANKIVSEWIDIERYLKLGSEYWEEHYTLGSLFEFLVRGKLQAWWLTDDGGPFMLGITEVIDYPAASSLRIFWIGGRNLKHSLPALTYADIVAVRLGCSKIEITGRKGFKKVLESFGYKQKAVLYTKDLTGVKEH